jgi:predicted nucleic-acid-binding protein
VANGAWLPHLALAKASWVLESVYELQPRMIATAIAMLLNHRNLSLQDPEVVAAAIDTFRRKPSLGFSDCLLLEVARKAGHLPLGTFDRDLARLDAVTKL